VRHVGPASRGGEPCLLGGIDQLVRGGTVLAEYGHSDAGDQRRPTPRHAVPDSLGHALGVPTPTHSMMAAMLKPYIMGAPA